MESSLDTREYEYVPSSHHLASPREPGFMMASDVLGKGNGMNMVRKSRFMSHPFNDMLTGTTLHGLRKPTRSRDQVSRPRDIPSLADITTINLHDPPAKRSGKLPAAQKQ
ncbi:hypothetical protein SAPIO_CDS10843 [Scedosporium apiospermum]|uniref:Uncharacterized protein n=1 Tax=Pseudallescheria apiosperma TaxID=563466 RepID=A0A084FUP1_PSEDA|nr:uncharacterized protein SAPIO_CDS10843 [Scedosporium apiospermum]KEZ38803.1 hypothetical protein SAPIO_CDS10843 [Scedosporium apiospermum]